MPGLNFRKIFYSLFFIFISFSGISCNSNRKATKYRLETGWEVSTVSFNGPYKQISIKELNRLENLIPGKCGFVWVRNTFTIPEELSKGSIGIYFDNIQTAGQVYFNRRYLGKAGEFPPKQFSDGLKCLAVAIPESYVNRNNQDNELIVQVWVNGLGRIQSVPFVSTVSQVNLSKEWHNTLFSKQFFLFTILMIFFFATYIVLYFLRRNIRYYLSFSLMNLCTTFYLLNFSYVEFPVFYSLNISLLTIQKIFQGCFAHITGYFAVSFIRDFLNEKDTPTRKIYRIFITILPCIAILTTRSLHQFYVYLNISYLFLAVHIGYVFRLLIRSFLKKNSRVRTLLIGFSPILSSLVLVFINLFLPRPYVGLIILALAWQFTLFAFLCILLTEFATMCSKVEYLNMNLEHIVKDRTDELQLSNKKLEEVNLHLEAEQRKTKREIELARVIQESFYIQNIPIFEEWEVSFYFKPLEGVSGDLYDIYYAGDQLDGVGIFDVSGHGMASGLVTMLVKNIIHDEFYKGLANELPAVMDDINQKIILQKGNIENYLTGILCRIRDNSTVEIINAGHPKPIFFNSQTKEVSFLESKEDNSIGVIGISGLDTEFKLISKKFNKNDTILLYTDGIIESMNKDKMVFGKNGLLKSFSAVSDYNVDRILDSIISDFNKFLNHEPVNDDITLFILRKL